MAMAFATSSSSATLPLAMQSAEEKLGVSQSTSSMVLPFGAVMNMDGTAPRRCCGNLLGSTVW
ncbi:dicarboxylate/amino acid:cation symporter [Vibrio chagasii]|nr:dicarboxylate/amino acid:cation symporter [Vibrio chagasii]